MKKVEDRTIPEMREFAAKAEIVIPKDKTKRADILEFLKNPKKSTDPTVEALAEHEAKERAVREAQAKTNADNLKRVCKKPLTEAEKVKLAQLEALARSGKSPDIDQMKELGLLRIRKMITPLSPVEERELEELEIKAQGGQVEAVKDSGLPVEERITELRKRSKINEN